MDLFLLVVSNSWFICLKRVFLYLSNYIFVYSFKIIFVYWFKLTSFTRSSVSSFTRLNVFFFTRIKYIFVYLILPNCRRWCHIVRNIASPKQIITKDSKTNILLYFHITKDRCFTVNATVLQVLPESSVSKFRTLYSH